MKRRLTRAFATAKFDAIFLESHINIRNHDHLVIDCIPVEDSAAEAIPFAFRSAITDLEGDWAQNVKLIDLRKRGGLRRSVSLCCDFYCTFSPTYCTVQFVSIKLIIIM